LELFEKASATAFEKTGLDPENDDDWKTLALFFSLAVFGGPSPGQPKRWPSSKLRRLLTDYAKIHAKHPNFSEEKCCGELIRDGGGQYNEVENAKTLMRVLQTAKREQSFERQMASLNSDDVLAGVSKLKKKGP